MNKKHFVSFFVIIVSIISIGIVVAKQLSEKSSSLEKIGKIKHIDHWQWWEPDKPPVTILVFEDGDELYFEGLIQNIEVEKTYRIVYHEVNKPFAGEWSGKYYVVDSVEEVKPNQ